MPAQRGASGRFIKGSGGSGAGGGAAPSAAPIQAAGDAAKKSAGPLDKVFAIFNKIGGAARKMAGGVVTADKTIKGITAAGHMGAAAIAGLGAAISVIASAPIPNATGAMSAFAGAIGSFVSGAGASINGALDAMADKLAQIGPYGQAAATAFRILGATIQAVTEVMGAATGVMGQMMGMAIDVAQKTDLMRARFAALAGSAQAGKAVQEMVSKLGQTLPFATAQVGEWAQSLLSAGFRGKALQTAIESVGAATALMGESGGAAAEKMLKTLAEGGKGADKMVKAIQEGGPKANKLLADMGLNVNDIGTAAQRSKMSTDQMGQAIEAALKKKGAGPLGDMMLSFPSILQKAREGFMSLFSGLGPVIKPFMKEVQKLFGAFNKGGPATKALKPIIGGVLADAFKWATKVVVVLQKIVARLSQPGPMKAFATAFKVIGAIAEFTVDAVLGFVLICIDVVSAVGNAITAIQKFGESAMNAASDFISGLVGGILGGIGDFVSAVSALASAGEAAFRSIFKMHSPSQLMDELGGYVGEGAAQGVEGSIPRVEGAAGKLGGAMAGASAKGATGGGAKGSGKSVVVNVEAGALVINAGGSTVTDEGLAIALERFALAVGA